MLGILDGTVLPADQVQIPVTDEGLLRGDGVFEVMRLYDGRPFAARRPPRAHGALGAQPAAADRRRRRPGRHRRAARGGAAHGRRRAAASSSPAAGGGSGSSSRSRASPRRSRWRRSRTRRRAILDGVKSLSYGANMLATRLAKDDGRRRGAARHAARPRPRGADVLVLLRPRRRTFVTPPLDGPHPRLDHPPAPADGVRRRASGRSRSTSSPGSQEAFLASTVREVLPVHSIDGRAVPVGGALTRDADERMRAQIAQELGATAR